MAIPRGPIRHERLTWSDVDRLVDILVPQLRAAGNFDGLMMVTRGGLVPGGLLSEILGISYVLIAAVDFPTEVSSSSPQLAASAVLFTVPGRWPDQPPPHLDHR